MHMSFRQKVRMRRESKRETILGFKSSQNYLFLLLLFFIDFDLVDAVIDRRCRKYKKVFNIKLSPYVHGSS
jgi:hypothetical protein